MAFAGIQIGQLLIFYTHELCYYFKYFGRGSELGVFSRYCFGREDAQKWGRYWKEHYGLNWLRYALIKLIPSSAFLTLVLRLELISNFNLASKEMNS